ncbi:MAG: tetratricopeptide repeat protein [Candidatus Aminicenantes bacterium]|nr:tetratricopeptide repeat protein [Candidatus Aminicenantes bacterium]
MVIDKENILDTAQKYVIKGQLPKAIREYLKLVEAAPQDKRLHLKLGDLYLKNGEEDKAIQTFLKVASLYGEEDLNFRAISIYKKILSINPKFLDAFHKIAKLYLKEGLAGNAKNYYQSILQIKPNDLEAIKGLKNIESPQQPKEKAFPPPAAANSSLSRSPRPPERKSVAETSDFLPPSTMDTSRLSSEPGISTLDKDAEMHYHLGVAYKEMELFDYAITEFELASASSTMKFDCYIMLGNCYMEKGDYNKSIECYKMSSKIQGLSKEKLAWLHFNLGLAYEASGKVSEAIDTFNLVLRLDHSFAGAKEKIQKLQSSPK